MDNGNDKKLEELGLEKLEDTMIYAYTMILDANEEILLASVPMKNDEQAINGECIQDIVREYKDYQNVTVLYGCQIESYEQQISTPEDSTIESSNATFKFYPTEEDN